MARVSDAIKYFIRKKMKEDPLWRHLKVIFSGHEIPGEGEHKIMQHIRGMRSQPNYRPNNRHCMYGQDADLIMLGLVSHEPHFTLLREVVDFSGGMNRNANALKTVAKFTKESDFQLLHLSILREYLEIEFAYQASKDTYDLEALIDDFVFMTFLVGNDFLPHMPSLDIGDGAFDLLFSTYKNQRPAWGPSQYLTKAGEISDASRLEKFLEVIGEAETEIFMKREENEAAFVKKRRKYDKRDGKPEGPSDEELAAEEASKQGDYLSMIEGVLRDHPSDAFVDGWTVETEGTQKNFKGRYYFEKLKLTPVDKDKHLALRQSYIEGLIWCLAYYFRGCISWSWFYPYHYGPMLSDLTSLPKIFTNIHFELSAPLKPFEQLMSCLPPASATLVPRPYRKLMLSSDSPILHFYPQTFEVDMNGKRNPWEGVNILPFIDVNLLKVTIASMSLDKELTADEQRRNSVGKVYCYTHDETVNDTVPSFNRDIGLPDILNCHSHIDVLEEPPSVGLAFQPVLIPGTTIPLPGFPSLNVLPIKSAELIGVGLNCFGSPSKYATTLLTLHSMPQLPPAEQLADDILGKSLFINWPMMHEARVVAVSDSICEVRLSKKKTKIKKFSQEETEQWQFESSDMTQQYLTGTGVPGSGGVVIGNVQIRLLMTPLQGMKTSPIDGSTKKLFGKEEADVPLQMALWKAPAQDLRFVERGPLTLKDRFPPNSRIILTKGKHRGCTGSVIGVLEGEKVGVRIQIVPPEPPFGLAIARSIQDAYLSSSDAAKVLGLRPVVFGKITGALLVDPGRYDLGLNLKYKQDLYVLGYTRRIDTSNTKKKKGKSAWKTGDSLLVVGNKRTVPTQNPDDNPKVIWEYTPKAIRLVAAYKQQFPQLFAALNKYPNERFYDAKKMFGPEGESTIPKQIREWLDNIETAKLPRLPSATKAMPASAIVAVQRAADVRVANLQQEGPPKEINIKVPPVALYREGSTKATDVLLAFENNANVPPELGDRVANLCANGIPFGARGTVVSIHDPVSGCVEVVMDEEFMGGSTLQGSCASFRGKLCVWAHLLRISTIDTKGIVDHVVPSGPTTKSSSRAAPASVPRSESKSRPSVQRGTDVGVKLTVTMPPSHTKMDKTNEELLPPKAQTPVKVVKQANDGSAKGGGRQGFWREAVGPPENGIGFRRTRRGKKSGMQAWHHMVSTAITSPEETIETQNNPPKELAQNFHPEGKTASEGLKALLGVSGQAGLQTANTKQLNDPSPELSGATEGLKAMLGLGLGSNTQPSQEETQPATAADALLAMMKDSNDTSTTHSPILKPEPKFNFTYTKDGEDPPDAIPSPPAEQPNADRVGVYPVPATTITHPAMFAPQLAHVGAYPLGYNANSLPSMEVPIVKREKKSGVSLSIIPSIVATKSKK